MQDSAESLLQALQEEERTLNAEIEADALSLCATFAQSFLLWQEKSGTIRDLSFTGADIISHCFSPLYQFLNTDDGVPRKVKSELCKATLQSISLPFFETFHKKVTDKRIEEKRPSCHWEKRRIRLRLQAYDILIAQLPVLHQTLGKMGYQHYATQEMSQSVFKNFQIA